MAQIVSRVIKQGQPDYPTRLLVRLDEKAPKDMAVLGNVSILKQNLVGVFCADKSHNDLLIEVDGLVRKWCAEDKTFISGFQSTKEKAIAKIILDYQRPAVLCLGRALAKGNISPAIKKGVLADRLLVLCPFENAERATKELDIQRNLIVAALSDSILVAHRKGDYVTENLLAETNQWNIPTTVLELTKEVNNIDSGIPGSRYSVVKRVLPLFSKVEKPGQVIGKNGLGEVRPPH